MSRFQKPYTRWWLSLCSIGLVVCIIYAAVVAAQTKGAPKELKLGFVDFFSGSAAIFGVSGKNAAELLVDKWNKEGGIKGVPVKMVEVDENGGPDNITAIVVRVQEVGMEPPNVRHPVPVGGRENGEDTKVLSLLPGSPGDAKDLKGAPQASLRADPHRG